MTKTVLSKKWIVIILMNVIDGIIGAEFSQLLFL